MEYKFQVGQKVLVRPDFKLEDTRGVGYVEGMELYRGKIVTIESSYQKSHRGSRYNGYHIVEDRGRWAWNEKQFTGVEQNEEELLKLLIQEKITPEIYKSLLQSNKERG